MSSERINSRNVRIRIAFPDREEFSKGGITTCIHIWNSGLMDPPWVDPFADSHREFLATFDQGEKEGDGRRDYIGMDCA